MQLNTDHEQFYDAVFDRRGPVFHRMAYTRGGLSKKAQFALFESLHLPTPPHGTVSELAAQLQTGMETGAVSAALQAHYQCVVYGDELAHRGEGKELLTLIEASGRDPGAFASMFIPQNGPPVSFRLIRFGRLIFWLRQQGEKGGWRSNQRDEETFLGREMAQGTNPIPRVLWAIDFIPGPSGLLAVDFNTAPELVTLGECGALTSDEALAELVFAAEQAPEQMKQF